MPKLPKITSLLFFAISSEKSESLQIDAVILTVMVKHSQSSQNSKFSMSLQYLKKRS